eukprot:CAMPEP_0170144076 /NCGR_PEP_ID=MMETSP0033_2-20121228/13291_1 /TAXON_ID=195969 /ORGANISM="Dolichomastix tenuilepis, Strain CCMP3274" /LENGTH=130 /DNA_ID=CAMNT_0010380557 /DNA_START=104 /DNA_END=492 /DNA_ORIENTATION=-
MVTQLIEHQRIKTTVPKAKALKRLADKVVTISKEGTLAARRRVAAIVFTDEAQHKLFGEMRARYSERAGGFTRVLRTHNRKGDNAPMAFIEYVDRPGELRPAMPPRGGQMSAGMQAWYDAQRARVDSLPP